MDIWLQIFLIKNLSMFVCRTRWTLACNFLLLIIYRNLPHPMDTWLQKFFY
jgi:hypothetical protein